MKRSTICEEIDNLESKSESLIEALESESGFWNRNQRMLTGIGIGVESEDFFLESESEI